MAKKTKFSRDLDRLLLLLEPSTEESVMEQLVRTRDRLVDLHKRRLVKINHSVLEVLCARFLMEQGYSVCVEQPIDGGALITDLYAVRANHLDDPEACRIIERQDFSDFRNTMDSLLVEIETGFVPPSAALNPGRYRQTRIAAKIARYGGYSHKFALATPVYHVLQVPHVLLHRPEERDMNALRELKEICDMYYSSPPILLETLASTVLDSIYIIDVDRASVRQVAPDKYIETIDVTGGFDSNSYII